jgi:hypothetical protein
MTKVVKYSLLIKKPCPRRHLPDLGSLISPNSGHHLLGSEGGDILEFAFHTPEKPVCVLAKAKMGEYG